MKKFWRKLTNLVAWPDFYEPLPSLEEIRRISKITGLSKKDLIGYIVYTSLRSAEKGKIFVNKRRNKMVIDLSENGD